MPIRNSWFQLLGLLTLIAGTLAAYNQFSACAYLSCDVAPAADTFANPFPDTSDVFSQPPPPPAYGTDSFVTSDSPSDEAGMADQMRGATGAPTDPSNDQTYFSFQVETQVEPIEATLRIAYPQALRGTDVTGEVAGQFVIDTLGRVERSTFKVLASDNPNFADAVRAHLPRMRFYAARVGDRKVRQLVQRVFVFDVPN